MIAANVKRILGELPEGVELAAAAKTRSAAEIEEALRAGIRIIGENYLQDAERVFESVTSPCRWHFIGHLQRNKVKKVIRLFDMIETVDSPRLAREINKRCAAIDKIMPVLVEINSGREENKDGIFPEEAGDFIRKISQYPNLQIKGLMTMGPFTGDPEDARPYFVETRRLFDQIGSENIPGVDMEVLSMGMSNSYRVAIEEGASLVRIGTGIFGPRPE